MLFCSSLNSTNTYWTHHHNLIFSMWKISQDQVTTILQNIPNYKEANSQKDYTAFVATKPTQIGQKKPCNSQITRKGCNAPLPSK